MKIDEVDGAACAVAEEVLEIFQAHGVLIGTTSVGNGRCTNKSFASKWLHILLVVGDSRGNAHTSTSSDAEVGFVERHQCCGTIVDGNLCRSWPFAEEVRVIVVKKRNKFESRVEVAVIHTRGAAWSVVPVVGPRDLTVLTVEREWHGQIGLIVRKTTLAEVSNGCGYSGSRALGA